MTPKRWLPLILAGVLSIAGCGGDGGTSPGPLRFGQIGEIRLHLVSPLSGVEVGQGELQQSLTWSSSGPWQLTELITYKGEIGDENTSRSPAGAEVLASDYAIWITQVNDLETLNLFDPELVDPSLRPECGPTRSKLSLAIRDASLGEEKLWVRCVDGTLENLVTLGASPGVGAARVANAALLVREYVFPPPAGFASSFRGSFPFATLARGEDTPVQVNAPFLIGSRDAWIQFWITHTGSIAGIPAVDFQREMVLVAAIGARPEAGETVEIRRVLPNESGTLVEVVHRVPGNFCSPVARTHRPIHVVVTPVLPTPVRFGSIRREEVPCG